MLSVRVTFIEMDGYHEMEIRLRQLYKYFSILYDHSKGGHILNNSRAIIAGMVLISQVFALPWHVERVDQAGDVGRHSSLVLDSSGNPHISYFDYTNEDLKYASWIDYNWIVQTVDSVGMVGKYTSLALDSFDNPHISYFDYSNNLLKYAFWNGTNWSIEIIDNTIDGSLTSLNIDSSEYPHIAYVSNEDLKYAHWNGYSWDIQVVESGNVAGDMYSNISMVLDFSENPHIAYRVWDGHLRYAIRILNSWEIATVDSSGYVGIYPALALDSSENPHIAYWDYEDYYWSCYLKYAYFNNSIWEIEIVRTLLGPGGFTSMALDVYDHAHISYTDNTDLKYTYWNGASWETEIVDSEGSLWNFTSIALDSSGWSHISYYEAVQDDLKYATNEINGITSESGSSLNSFAGVLPNPSRGSVSICFSVADQTPIGFSIFDITGRLVFQIEHDVYPIGNNNLQLEILSQGIYFCRMTAGEYSATQRFVVTE